MDLTAFGFRKGFDPDNKTVKQEVFTYEGNEYLISTVDLGLNHNFGDGDPLYFETMIFPKDSWSDMYCYRYTTRTQAEQGHDLIIEKIKNGKITVLNGWFEELEESKNA